MEIINDEKKESANNANRWHNGSKARLLWYAIAIIACGVIWIASNAGLVSYHWHRVLIAWPMLLIVIGTGELIARNTTAGVILAGVGVFFELPRLGDVFTAYGNLFDRITDNWWPLLLILAGILIIVRLCRHTDDFQPWKYGTTSKIDIDAAGGITIEETFSGSKHIYTEPEFHGGSIKAVFGGVDLDLRATTLPAGETVLYIEAVFGGVEILAPADWNIKISGRSAFGGFDDKRRPIRNIDNGSKLIIVANCTFGGGDIK